MPACSSLTGNATADVCIVGGGIAGVTTAYLLAGTGLSVVLLESTSIGGGETGRTTAHLATALDHLHSEVERDVDASRLPFTAQSHGAAISVIEGIVSRERIECAFERVDGYLFAPPPGKADVLRRELDAAHRVGLTDVTLEARAPLLTYDTGPGLRFPRQAQFHPLQYLAGLAQGVTNRGGRIYTGAHVVRVRGGPTPSVETSDGYVVSSGAVVVATNSPVHENLLVHTKQAPYRTYVIGASVPRGRIPRALYWDTAEPFHYVRLHDEPGRPARGAGTEWLIVGGEDHRAGEQADGAQRFDALEAWARERFPIDEVEFRWSGQVMESVDGVGLIGRDRLDQPNVYMVTGDSGQGMTHGTIAGVLVTDLIAGCANAWSALYDPTRTPSLGADFIRRGLDVSQS